MPGIAICKSVAFTRVKGYCAAYKPVFNKLIDLDDVPDIDQRYQQNLMARTIAAYVGWADWADIFYYFANQYNNGGGALINWINPGIYDAVEVPHGGALIFTTLEGLKGDGSAYLNTIWNPSIHGINYKQNDAAVFCYLRISTATSDKMLWGVTDNVNYNYAQIRPSNFQRFRINDATNIGYVAGADVKGFYYLHRTAVNADELFINDISQATGNHNSTGLPNNNLYILNYGGAGAGYIYDGQVSCFGAGGSLSSANKTILMNVIEANMDYNGKGIL